MTIHGKGGQMNLQSYKEKITFDCNIKFYDDAFADWNGDTGFHLHYMIKVIKKSEQIYFYTRREND